MGATLASVEQYDFRVSPQTPASVMYAEFQRDPMLPGGIVADGEKVIGLLSRAAVLSAAQPSLWGLFVPGRPGAEDSGDRAQCAIWRWRRT